MRVIKARVLGFCAGVRRTVDLALDTAHEQTGRKRLFTMGPLIHNGRTLRELADLGFSVLDEEKLPETLVDSATVIRAHGVGPQTRRELLRRGTKIIDATCPKVRKSQLKAQELSKKGFAVFIAGEKNHGEVRGIRMFAPNSLVVENGEAAFEMAKTLFSINKTAKTAMIGQTTISTTEYKTICAAVRQFFPDLAVYDTICGATLARQEALAGLCTEVDALVIAGDPTSSNTRRLFAVAVERGKPAWIVSDASALPPELASFGIVGISAGTSTPDALIGEIELAISLLQC
ncbi:MAG: 4-hydroxy-3-methylbut-2-enyl diphosphate reductase [Spirochaetaceae bacterium]|nr:4-hydroxy-3-methylbut-2-enyl diphosphate reductase [Spirochaetaceae bacterium]